MSSGCSRTFEQEFGYLKSPGWPEVYPHGLDCTILLKAPQGSTISLFFNSFDVESHPSCQYDYLEVSLDPAAPSLNNPVILERLSRWRHRLVGPFGAGVGGCIRLSITSCSISHV